MMSRFFILLFRSLLTVTAAILISVSTSREGYAKNNSAARENNSAAQENNSAAQESADRLQALIFQDPELWQQDVTINGQSIPILYAMPCLRGNAESIASDFRGRTGFELSGFAAMVQGDGSGQNKDVWLGVYENYSFLSTVRIATAPLLDPDLLPALGTAYAFPLADILDGGGLDRQQLASQVLDGSVGVTEHLDDGSYKFILPSSENWHSTMNMIQPADGDLDVASPTYVFTHARRNFQGVNRTHLVARAETKLFQSVREKTAPHRVIAWNTDQPLRAVLLESYREILLESMRARAAVCTDDKILKPENGGEVITEERQ